MVSTTGHSIAEPQPAWDIARLYPSQGHWTQEDFMAVTRSTNWLVELTDGRIEVLAMPRMWHQLIVQYVHVMLLNFVQAHSLGRVLPAPFHVRLRQGLIRDPDVMFMSAAHAARMKQDAWDGADLVIEVVSEGREDRQRDLVQKRREYAEAGILEYWIIDPLSRAITVLTLPPSSTEYAIAGEHRLGHSARSLLLPGFELDVQKVWDAAEGELPTL